MKAELFRYQQDERRTLGRFTLAGFNCYSLELPWRDNASNVSCIPPGDYVLKYRRSPLIARLTRGEFEGGYEVADVPGRTYIMIHHGNWPRNTHGCILLGRQPREIGGELGVPSSLPTFREFMGRLKGRDAIPLTIWHDESLR